MAALLVWVMPASAEWKAYNDHGLGTVGTETHVNATTLSVNAAGSVTLKNITDGAATPATLTISITGTAPTTGATANPPTTGTPLATEFNGYVWFDDSRSGTAACVQIKAAGTVHYTFSGLDQNKRYIFKGGAVRGGSGGTYPQRWTISDISGVDSAEAAHQTGGSCAAPYIVLTAANVGDASLTGLQAAINTGQNTCGAMFCYSNIAVGSDGTFEITCSQYLGTVPGGSSQAANDYGYAISGLSLEEVAGSACGILAVTVSPTNASVVECSPLTLSASPCGGTPPYNYQWYKDGGAVDGATSATLVFANIHPSDAGDYFVLVTDDPTSGQMVVSDYAVVAVTADPTAPTIVSAVGAIDLTTITVSFSKPISITGVSAFSLVPALTIDSATVTNQTNVILVTAPRQAVGYRVVVNSGVQSCGGLPVTPGSSVPVVDQRNILQFNAQWQYNDANTDLGTAWLGNAYDDHGAGWLTGSGVFDGKSTGDRTTICGQTVGTHFVIPAAADLPTYYFRTHVTWPAGADTAASALTMRLWVDDGIILYVNGVQAYKSSIVTNGVNDGFSQYLGATVGDPPSAPANVALGASFFHDGDNVIAVYLKQGNATSTDLSLVLAMDATISNWVAVGGPIEVSNITTSATVAQCGTLNLRADVKGGVRPNTYQWFRGGTGLSNGGTVSGADSVNLTIANVQPGDAGNYHLHVTDSTSPPPVQQTNGADIVVSVTPDTAPALVSALSSSDLHTITVTFSKNINIGTLAVRPADGGADAALSTSFVTNGNQVVLVTVNPLEAKNYNIVVVSGVTGTCSGLAASGSIRLVQRIILFGTGVSTGWQYNQAGVDLGTGWVAPGYDDTSAGWATGTALFDGKTPQPPGRAGITNAGLYELVGTQLNLTNANFPATGLVIPSYYFRKHFTLPYNSGDYSLSFRSMFDDYSIIYVNGQEAYRATNIVATNEAFGQYIELGATVGTAWWSAATPLSHTNAVKGANVLAVYLKQATLGSSDATMGLEVTANVTNFPPTGPRLTIVDQGTSVQVSWTPTGGTLWYSTDLINWTQGTTANPQNVSKVGVPYKFFEVRQ